MYRLHLRLAPARRLAATGIATVLAAGLACGSASGARAAAPPGRGTSPSPASQPSPVRRLLLINGDRLAVTTTGGRPAVTLWSTARHDAITSLRFGGQALEIPVVAMPYLGHGLSPSLFQLSALEKAESGGRLPVRVAFAGRRPAIPGLRFTASSAGRASGYLTAASARAFGAALARQYAADHARGTYGSDGMFGRGVRIWLAGAPAGYPAGAGARPDFPMHTLTVRATSLRGRPDTGDSIFITSADNVERFDGLDETSSGFWHGRAKFSLPAGHYWAVATFTSGTGRIAALRMVVLPQFTVAGRDTVVRVAARSASSKVTLATPHRSVAQLEGFDVVRGARAGWPASYAVDWFGLTGWVSPTTRRPTVGTLRTFTSGTLTSPAGVSPGYAYDLDLRGPAGLVPPQDFTIRPASLGAVTERYYQDVPTSNAGWAASGGTPYQLAPGGPPPLEPYPISREIGFRLPQVQTQYFSAGRDLLWNLETYTNASQFTGGDTDLWRTYAGGQRQAQDWNAFPLHPAPDTTLGGLSAVFPAQASASRAGNTLNLYFTPFSDNQFGHLGPGYAGNAPSVRVTGTYAVAENGATIARGSALDGIPAIPLSSRPSVVRLTLTASRRSQFLPLSPASRTVWTWPSARDTAARVPPAWFCSITYRRGQFRFPRQCAVQHLMTLSYHVPGMSLTGLTRPGPQVVDVTAGHIQLGGAARVTRGAARVSFNDGGTWIPATVTARGGGRFRVTYTAPPGAGVTLRFSASDAAGSSISETIIRGYGVARAAASPAGFWPLAGPARIARVTAAARHGLQAACPRPRPGDMRCFALVQPQFAVNQALAAGRETRPRGWTPRELERAYRLPVSRRSHQTIAVSIAGRTPHLASYLRTYRKEFGLPPCGQASGCLRIVNQDGRATPAAPSSLGTGWDVEATLDVSMISAACPYCKIIVVEASSPTGRDLARSEDTAARLGAQVISNSYGIAESGYSQTFARAYHHPGHMIVAASGDTGFDAANFPANLGTVTAVGGTTLSRARDARGFTERVWNEAGTGYAGSSGCSAYVTRPPWQHSPHCPGRTVGDTSAVAASIPIYDRAWGGWLTVGGTSVAAPLIAGVYGLAGNAARVSVRYLYRHPADFFDVIRGSNVTFGSPEQTCGDDYLCVAKRGYDAPTGLGTPDGLAAF